MPRHTASERRRRASAHRKSKALKHADRPGAGARARRRAGLRGREKVAVVMSEFKRGTLRSGGSGKRVTSRDQAVAIAMSEAGLSRRRRGKKRRRASRADRRFGRPI